MSKKTWLFTLLGVGLGLYGFNATFVWFTRKVILGQSIVFTDESEAEGRSVLEDAAAKDSERGEVLSALQDPVPFVEVDVFGEDGLNYSNPLSLFGGAGVTIFDANGDGRPDVYLSFDGQNWTRPTDASGTMADKPRLLSNVLFINLGNDGDGKPRYKPIHELAKANDTYVEQELLVEDFLFPRKSCSESRDRPGRASSLAVAADFNNDGRLDLLVGNCPPGIPWSHEKTQRVLGRFVNPVGREARHSKLPLASLPNFFFPYKPQQSLDETRETARGVEPKGANSLYLNMGDADKDGLPEWRDASRDTKIEGCRTTSGLAVADIDLDGDLDVYVANVMDLDYWPGGSKGWAGGANKLYINQLAQTGELGFVEQSAAMGCDGVFDEGYAQPQFHRARKLPVLPPEYSFQFMKFEAYVPDLLEINGGKAEPAEISWSTVFQDVNDDGYPDIWVANDLGLMRLYINDKGERFTNSAHARSERTGMWMTFAPTDLTGDLKEDLVAGNLGGGLFNNAFVAPDFYGNFNPTIIDSLAAGTMFRDTHDPTHAIIDGAQIGREIPHRVFHSKVMPPETSIPNNSRKYAKEGTVGAPWDPDMKGTPFEPDTIDSYEFSWGMTPIDVQNDGRDDIYYVGCLYTRGGGLFPVIGSGPGRLLVNATTDKDKLRLIDQTAEYHLFNIEELQYDRLESEGYVYRRSPAQNWRKRDMVYSYDRSTWTLQGIGVQERVTNSDMLQTAENGRAAVAADLNNDGYADIIVSNTGGYDSRSSKSKNLKIRQKGVARVVPPPDPHYFILTNFEPGRTRVFLNRFKGNQWIKVRLIDDSEGSFNRDAVGAKVVINNRKLKVKRAGDGGYLGNTSLELLFGLGADSAKSIEVRWPDKARSVTKLELKELSGGILTISKTRGLVSWQPQGE